MQVTTTSSLYRIMKSVDAIAFSALTLLGGYQEGQLACKKTEWWDTGMVITVSCSRKSRLVLSSWLADRTIGRTFGTLCRPSVCRLSVCL